MANTVDPDEAAPYELLLCLTLYGLQSIGKTLPPCRTKTEGVQHRQFSQSFVAVAICHLVHNVETIRSIC